jgi:hypothetical protein
MIALYVTLWVLLGIVIFLYSELIINKEDIKITELVVAYFLTCVVLSPIVTLVFVVGLLQDIVGTLINKHKGKVLIRNQFRKGT